MTNRLEDLLKDSGQPGLVELRELLDVLPTDVLDELNSGAIDLKDPAFLDGLTDHVSRLSLASMSEVSYEPAWQSPDLNSSDSSSAQGLRQ